MSIPYRVSAVVIDENGRTAKVSFVVRSGIIPGWAYAVERAHAMLANQQVVGDISVDEIYPDIQED